jgi:hypothetical protein
VPSASGRHLSGIADPLNGHIDDFRIAHVQRSDGWIETTWNNVGDPEGFVVAGTEGQEGGEPPPLAGTPAISHRCDVPHNAPRWDCRMLSPCDHHGRPSEAAMARTIRIGPVIILAATRLLPTGIASAFTRDAATVLINELRYDNTRLDQNEAVEIAGLSETDLTGWRPVLCK